MEMSDQMEPSNYSAGMSAEMDPIPKESICSKVLTTGVEQCPQVLSPRVSPNKRLPITVPNYLHKFLYYGLGFSGIDASLVDSSTRYVSPWKVGKIIKSTKRKNNQRELFFLNILICFRFTFWPQWL